jgi:ferredoxin--NADP+ reductase
MNESTHWRAMVESRREISADLWVVRISPEKPVPFLAGQYVTIGIDTGKRIIERPYSVVSAPAERELEFFLERVPAGELTPLLYDIPPGGSVLVRRTAKGRFLFDRQSGRSNHFMTATVTGVAPFLSMLRDFAAKHEPVPHRVTLLHAASVPAEFAYLGELENYARVHPWFRYIPTISRIWSEPTWKGEIGRAEDILRKHLDADGFTAADTTVYLCGHPQMIENAKAILRRAGFAKEMVKEERYWVTKL